MTYLRTRYYDSGVRRFISEDPAQDGVNWYAYCENNPVMFMDPTGLYEDGDQYLTPDHIAQIFMYSMMYCTGEIFQSKKMCEKAANDAQYLRNVDDKTSYHFGLDATLDYSKNINESGLSFMRAFVAGLEGVYSSTKFLSDEAISDMLGKVFGDFNGAVIENMQQSDDNSPVNEFDYYIARLGNIKSLKEDYGGYLDVSVKVTGAGSYINVQYEEYSTGTYVNEDFFKNTYWYILLAKFPQ